MFLFSPIISNKNISATPPYRGKVIREDPGVGQIPGLFWGIAFSKGASRPNADEFETDSENDPETDPGSESGMTGRECYPEFSSESGSGIDPETSLPTGKAGSG
jgi:hypothetical protein